MLKKLSMIYRCITLMMLKMLSLLLLLLLLMLFFNTLLIKGGVLNYCNFKAYLLIIPDVPIGRIICISLYPDVYIERITKSHEEIPSVVSRVISTLVNIILSCLCLPREVSPVNFSGADLLEWIIKWTEEYKYKWGSPHFYTDTHLCIAHGERERHICWREAHLFLGIVFYLL